MKRITSKAVKSNVDALIADGRLLGNPIQRIEGTERGTLFVLVDGKRVFGPRAALEYLFAHTYELNAYLLQSHK